MGISKGKKPGNYQENGRIKKMKKISYMAACENKTNKIS